MKLDSYQLRQAAGRYWLLDMNQKGLSYKRPLCINEGGALLWEWLSEGYTKEQIVCRLCDDYGLSKDEAADDLDSFLGQLKEHNIVL